MPNPSLLAVKLTNAASFYTKPYKWNLTPIPTHSPLNLYRGMRRLSRYAPLANYSNLQITNSKYNNNKPPHRITDPYRFPLGFSFINRERSSIFSSSSSSSSSSPAGPGLDSVGPGGVVDEEEDMSKVEEWRENGRVKGGGALRKGIPRRREEEEERDKLLTLPTVLTLGRVAAVPLLVATFYVDSWWGRTATTSIFIAAAVTDWLDGYLARKMHSGSAFGAFLDPVADKLMVAATLVLLCTRPFEVPNLGHVPWLLTIPSIAIIGREITMSAVREWAASKDRKLLEAVAVNNLGKWKTATQMIALTVLLATWDSNAGILVASGVVLLYVSASLSLWSLFVYMSKIWRVLLK